MFFTFRNDFERSKKGDLNLRYSFPYLFKVISSFRYEPYEVYEKKIHLQVSSDIPS
jgi:hypothetical protein